MNRFQSQPRWWPAARQQQLVLTCTLVQSPCGALDGLGISAGAPCAHGLFDQSRQMAQAVTQLA